MNKIRQFKKSLFSLTLLVILSQLAISQNKKVDNAQFAKLIQKQKFLIKKHAKDSSSYSFYLKNKTGGTSSYDSLGNFLYSDSSNYYFDEMIMSEISICKIKLQFEKNLTEEEKINYANKIDSLSVVLEREPSYSDNDGNFVNFMNKNIDPDIPVKKGAPEGKYIVSVKFRISKIDGRIDNIAAESKNGFGMEEEVIRVLKRAGKWKRGIKDGKYADSYRKQKIHFSVDSVDQPKTIGKIFNGDALVAFITEEIVGGNNDTIREFFYTPQKYQTLTDVNEMIKASRFVYFTNNQKPSESAFFYIRLLSVFHDDSVSVSYRQTFDFYNDTTTNNLTSRFILGRDSVSISIVEDQGVRKAKFWIEKKYSDFGNKEINLNDENYILLTENQVDTLFGEIKVDSLNANFFFKRGSSKHNLKDYQGAIDDYTRAIEMDSTNSESFLNRGVEKHRINDYKGAIEDYNKALQIDPNDLNSYSNRALAKVLLEDYRGAIIDYNKSIEINPNNADFYYLRGYAKGNLEDNRGAIIDYSKAIEIDPKDARFYFKRGYAKSELMDYEDAIIDYTKAIEIDSNRADFFFKAGSAKSKLKHYQEAIIDFTKAIEIDPNNADFFFNKGYAKAELEDYEGSIIEYTKAIEINPKDAFSYFNRGVSKFNLDQKGSACLDFNKAGELGNGKAYEMIKKYCN